MTILVGNEVWVHKKFKVELIAYEVIIKTNDFILFEKCLNRSLDIMPDTIIHFHVFDIFWG